MLRIGGRSDVTSAWTLAYFERTPMMFFPNDAKLCSKKSLKQPNRTSIYKLTNLNFKWRGGWGGESITGFVESSLEQLQKFHQDFVHLSNCSGGIKRCWVTDFILQKTLHRGDACARSTDSAHVVVPYIVSSPSAGFAPNNKLRIFSYRRTSAHQALPSSLGAFYTISINLNLFHGCH